MKHAGIFVMGALSILYIAVILFLRGNDALELLRAGNLNELGDFLAGVFTPLAFGWLVYGYLLQSKEMVLIYLTTSRQVYKYHPSHCRFRSFSSSISLIRTRISLINPSTAPLSGQLWATPRL